MISSITTIVNQGLKGSLFFIALVLFSPLLYSDSFSDIFNKAAAKHQGEFKNLMQSRGLPSVSAKAATLENIIEKLERYDRPTSLLFYENSEEELRIWAINSSGETAMMPVAISQQALEQKLYGFRKGINTLGFQIDRAPTPKRGKLISLAADSEKTDLPEISKLLLPGDIHKVISDTEQLLIIPSSGIGSIPFSTLNLPGENGRQLIDATSITVLPSLFDTDNAIPHRYDDAEIDQALIVGNPLFANDPDWDFPQLPGAEEEARVVSSYFQSEPLVGDSATKTRVLEEIESAQVIYFASHGIASSSAPLEESFIALSGTDGNDSRLTAGEIQRLSLQAKLVVLSACQTGLGKVEAAGIVGLARAFKIAGAEEVVVSLWNVDDNITARLMSQFIQNYVEEQLTASTALRDAMLKLRSQENEARLWAPFIVFSGEGTIVENKAETEAEGITRQPLN